MEAAAKETTSVGEGMNIGEEGEGGKPGEGRTPSGGTTVEEGEEGGGRGKSEEGGGGGGDGGRVKMKTGKAKRKEKRLRNEPLSVAGEDIPIALNVLDFAEARATELHNVTKALEGKGGGGGGGGGGEGGGVGKRVFQQLPRHMRRRTMSHNVRRLPRRLREKALKEAEKQTSRDSGSRKKRRKTKNLREEYARRQRSHAWLETHIWHAKRMHMTDYHGYRVAKRAADKGVRQAYRSMQHGCLMSDISYYCCIEVEGERGDILHTLAPLFPPDTGPSIAAKAYTSGAREGHTVMYHANQYPYRAIGPVQFLWQPPISSSTDDSTPTMQTDVTKDETATIASQTAQAGSTTSQTSLCKQATKLWIVCSPAMYEEAMSEISGSVSRFLALNEQSQTAMLDDGMEQGQALVSVRSLKDELIRFRLIGPRSHALVMETLKPVFSHNLMEPTRTQVEGSGRVLDNVGGAEGPKRGNLPGATPNQPASDDLASIPDAEPWWNGDRALQAHSWVLNSFYGCIKSTASASEIPRGMAIGLVVQDPRLFTPTKKTDMVSSYYPKKRGVVGQMYPVEQGKEEEEEDKEKEEEVGEDEENMEEEEREGEEEGEEEEEDEEGEEEEPMSCPSGEASSEEEEREEEEGVGGSNGTERGGKVEVGEMEVEGRRTLEGDHKQNPLVWKPSPQDSDPNKVGEGEGGETVGTVSDLKEGVIGVSATTSTANTVGTLAVSPILAHSPVWDPQVRDVVKMSRIPDHILNNLRSKSLSRSQVLDLGPKSPRIPVLLIQQSSPAQPSGILQVRDGPLSGAYSRVNQSVTTSPATGWDLILPTNWAMAFWIALVYRGARACGLTELQKCYLESGTLHFPHDYPDTSAGRVLEEEQRKTREEKFCRRPPDKRRNYGKLLIPHPFSHPWEPLVRKWRRESRVERLLQERGVEAGMVSDSEGESEESGESGFDSGEETEPEVVVPLAKRLRVTSDKLEVGLVGGKVVLVDLNHPAHPESDIVVVGDPSVHISYYVLRSKLTLAKIAHFLSVLFSHKIKWIQSHSYQRRNSLPSFSQSLPLPTFHALLKEHEMDKLLRDNLNALIAVSFEMLQRGATLEQATISVPSSSDLRNLVVKQRFQGPEEVIHPKGLTVVEGEVICVGVSGLTRRQTDEVKAKRKAEAKERRAAEKNRGLQKLPRQRVISSITKDFNLQPATPSRHIIGYVTSAGYRLCSSKSGGIALCTLGGLLESARKCYSAPGGEGERREEERGGRGERVGGETGRGKGKQGRERWGGGGGEGGGGGKGGGIGELLVLVRGETIQYRFAKCSILL